MCVPVPYIFVVVDASVFVQPVIISFTYHIRDALTYDPALHYETTPLCQMCFSSQYYMMMTVHVNGIVYFVLGVQMMIRKVRF